MNIRSLLRKYPVVVLTALAVAAVLGALAWYHWIAALCFGALLAALAVAALLRVRLVQQRREGVIATLAQRMDITQGGVLAEYPVPVLVCDEKENILFFNQKFRDEVAGTLVIEDAGLRQFTQNKQIAQLADGKPRGVAIGERFYSLYASGFHHKEKQYYALYYTDNTYFRSVEQEYQASRPYVLLLDVDDIGQMGLGLRDSEYAEIRNGIEALIEIWMEALPCLLRRLSDERYIIVAQERDVDQMILKRFDVLDAVRKYAYREKELGITLSIGVGTGRTLADGETSAHRALEMAIGRGGDQAAIKIGKSYEFFGGVSKSVEKRGQVKTRAVAASLTELIAGSDSVVVMGHTFPDLDAMGAAVGIVAIAQSQQKKAHIVVSPERSLARALLERAKTEYDYDVIVSPAQAEQLLAKNGLLILVDTHVESLLDFPALYGRAKTVVLIDHHRRMVNSIEDAVIFYHDPNASSTCEMVTELIGYITPRLSRFEAEALLAGIMLDTKNFVLRTRVRTFDAAAFLKGKGADTVKVKRLFANSLEDNRQRYTIVANAQTYRDCAISVATEALQDIRIVTSQAADELLNVQGVRAAFVLFRDANGSACITARSYGEMNVQLVMEQLGGGGHRTMAAAQFPQSDVETVRQRLVDAIDERLAQEAAGSRR